METCERRQSYSHLQQDQEDEENNLLLSVILL